jgi:predicted site-specific integrase-resolvase
MGRTKPKLIVYRRVSTARQGASGLGLEGQDAAVAAYAHQVGAVVVRVYTEVETGRRADRPELARALADCKRSRATLLIAKLDRLTRNARFLLTLGLSHVASSCADSFSRNSSGVSLRNSQKPRSGNFKPSRPYGV